MLSYATRLYSLSYPSNLQQCCLSESLYFFEIYLQYVCNRLAKCVDNDD